MAHSPPQTQTLNLPSLLFVILLIAFSIHYFFFSKPPSSSASRRDRNAANPEHIEQIAQMFPQLSRRDIQWDLQRNGGSVQATTERVLSGRGLERVCLPVQFPTERNARDLLGISGLNHLQPPPSFQPIQPPPTSATSAPPPPKSSHPDLITRYNLASRVFAGSLPEASTPGEAQKAPVWSQNKAERQTLLQKRREDMVLAARRKLEEREREKARGGT
ncbi:MAG: hypothetical protein Q9201_006087 [Fulgogasparrea decipioides]